MGSKGNLIFKGLIFLAFSFSIETYCQSGKTLFLYDAHISESSLTKSLRNSIDSNIENEKRAMTLIGLPFIVKQLARKPVFHGRVFRVEDKYYWEYIKGELLYGAQGVNFSYSDGFQKEQMNFPVLHMLEFKNGFFVISPDSCCSDTLIFSRNSDEIIEIMDVECHEFSATNREGIVTSVFIPVNDPVGIPVSNKFPLSGVPVGLPKGKPIIQVQMNNFHWRLIMNSKDNNK